MPTIFMKKIVRPGRLAIAVIEGDSAESVAEEKASFTSAGWSDATREEYDNQPVNVSVRGCVAAPYMAGDRKALKPAEASGFKARLANATLADVKLILSDLFDKFGAA